MPTAAELVDRLTLEVPDFPEPGVLFRDLTPTLADADGLRTDHPSTGGDAHRTATAGGRAESTRRGGATERPFHRSWR